MELGPSTFLREFVDSWYISLKDPGNTQQQVLQSLLEGYAKTDYGQRFGAADVHTTEEFRSHFPVTNCSTLNPYFEAVKNGRYSALLPEPTTEWVMTRGSTGIPKLIPTTQTHLNQILMVGARAIVNFALRRNDLSVLEMAVLNLNFPSRVGELSEPSGKRTYGYSSGTYAKINPSLGAASLVPAQEEIDSLGGGITRRDWDARFELVYQRAKDAHVASLMGVTPVMLAFADFLRRKHGITPKQLWSLKGLFCTSVAKIQTKYAPMLRHSFGQVPIVEMYTATEGVFAQQLDDLPYISPNYDVYLFEVLTRQGAKLLHELRPREWGRVIVSTPLFPRYEMGDLIEALGKGYFRVFGRTKRMTVLEHRFFNLLTGRLF